MTQVHPLAADLDHVLAHTEGIWDELRGQRLFITGGTGFFGRWLLESFAWANDRLCLRAQAVVLSRNPAAFAAKAPHLVNRSDVEFVTGDVLTFTLPDGPYDYVIHAATEASVRLNAEEPLRMLDTIVGGTRRALEFARQRGVRKFLLTSSGAVYGRQPAGLTHIPEDYNGGPDPTDPRSAYGEGKRLAELLACLYVREYGVECKIARCFAFVGPFFPLDAHFAVGNFIRDALAGGPVRVSGDGTPFRTYLYAADLAVYLWTVLCRGEPGRPYNVGSDVALTISEVAHAVAHCARPCTEVLVCQNPVPPREAERYVPAVDRARKELGLHVRIALEDALRRTLLAYSVSGTYYGGLK